MCHSFILCSRENLDQALAAIEPRGATTLPGGIALGGVAYPGTFAPVFVAAHAGETPTKPDALFDLEVEGMRFGWPVEWKRDSVFNARFETLLRGGMWGDALAQRRCILPCEAFYESHHSETVTSLRTGRRMKKRYAFTAPNGGPLLLGAVYEGDAFSVMTTEPNGSVAPIHDRMPLVLTAAEARLWLDPTTPLDRIAAFADRSSIPLCAKPATDQPDTVEQPKLDL